MLIAAESRLEHQEIVTLFLALGVLLLAARLLGELARRLGQPAVLGELLAGVLLGRSVLGHLAPEAMERLFSTGDVPLVLHGLTTLGITLFLLVAGMEVQLSSIWRQGRKVLTVGLLGMLVPFTLAWLSAPLVEGLLAESVVGRWGEGNDQVFALFFGTALSITALPVIARTLMDLGLYRTDIGMIIVAAATFQDLIGWIVFSLLLGLIGSGDRALPMGATVWLTLAYVAAMLTLGRWAIHRALPFVHAHLSWPGGVLGLSTALALLAAAFTEWIGVHAIFGAFILGVALGDSHHLRAHTRATIDQFVSFLFAPLFFATVALHVDFVTHFDPVLVSLVLAIATAGKLAGVVLAGRLCGLGRRERWAIGVGMNARGAMEIILGLLAREAGLIGDRLFVALVVMALVTSAAAGPLMQRILRRRKARRWTDHVGAGAFLPELAARDPRAAITELASVCGTSGVSTQAVVDAVFAREALQPTGIGGEIALPHARLPGLTAPQIAIGFSRDGIDFDSVDGRPARLVALIVSPAEDPDLLLELYRQIVDAFGDEARRESALAVRSYTELLALLRTATEGGAARG